MTTIALKRGAPPPKRKPITPRKPEPATVALPVSAPVLRRNLVIALLALVIVVAIVIATLLGLPQRWGREFVRLSADAGFEIRHVEISGTREMAKLPVYQAALSGPTNAMLATDLAAMRRRLLDLPWVADASVARRLPDTLAITIVERRPVALWQYRRRFAAIDITGRPLAWHRLERYRDLPVVVGANANLRVRELLALAAAAPALSGQVDSGVLVGGRRWDVHFKTGETLALPDTPEAATSALRRFARLEASLGSDRKLLGGRFKRFDMRIPGQMTVGGPAVAQALEAAAKAAKTARPTSI